MIAGITFIYKGVERYAKIILSLDEDDCYIFTFLKDKDLVDEFGTDIDITTDCITVLPDNTTSPKTMALKNAILEAVKQLDEFKRFQLRKLFIRTEQLN